MNLVTTIKWIKGCLSSLINCVMLSASLFTSTRAIEPQKITNESEESKTPNTSPEKPSISDATTVEIDSYWSHLQSDSDVTELGLETVSYIWDGQRRNRNESYGSIKEKEYIPPKSMETSSRRETI